MMDLVAIEQIKQLKARYFRSIDTCNLDLLRNILAPDVKISFDSPTYQFELNGLEQAIEFYRSNFTNRRFGMHHGHTPEIEVNGDEAKGLWYLNDLFINLDAQTLLNGSAIYEDHYVKMQGEWRILRTGYKRLLEMIGPLDAQWSITSQPIN
ncbi:nuclear transport factor 2 family protein [Pseudomonas moorei]|uniref:SnoaL-like domain-containing protein n=1 Tax=Pseudomonas moorei TaxID=395599 RepID=A0A1H1GRV3_9PSED|nr:nuclear transport factor 2 family protein [Pseudomonas moorei]KAB0498038.1 nuclear transport factor 2 family protein [Pseudomonas moorei]SDR15900.1 SnoaL-like domain-containing protein [Pseudomonas moorei]